ncbi:prepilin-type cleavage/methylation domain-containing protein [Pseudidiomarina sediminum]|uniref:Prepilin-type cleavage/methylation domain-containing protein n=1 Tax=Pseudidiomarina sediminum TaxID=431675 RepID=A0A432YZE4_9GAMM|nr:type IV pilin protein [Pseudidiomarina sediminum]RUO68993.1 prepilin-type cleavage/methylation domain-containing protein [Pseudidiomarina sediminum]
MLKGKSEVRQHGFSLVELMLVVVVIAILATIALPNYRDYVARGHVTTAQADLATLALALTNRFQRQLTYPTVTTTTTAETKGAVTGWSPAEVEYFDYTLVSTASGYRLTATGKERLDGCVLKLSDDNTRELSGDCAGVEAW